MLKERSIYKIISRNRAKRTIFKIEILSVTLNVVNRKVIKLFFYFSLRIRSSAFYSFIVQIQSGKLTIIYNNSFNSYKQEKKSFFLDFTCFVKATLT